MSEKILVFPEHIRYIGATSLGLGASNQNLYFDDIEDVRLPREIVSIGRGSFSYRKVRKVTFYGDSSNKAITTLSADAFDRGQSNREFIPELRVENAIITIPDFYTAFDSKAVLKIESNEPILVLPWEETIIYHEEEILKHLIEHQETVFLLEHASFLINPTPAVSLLVENLLERYGTKI